MDSMREALRKNLGRSLQALPELDRLRAAWPVACGAALAEKGEIVSYADGVARIEARNSVWLEQLRSMHQLLRGELGRIAGVPLTGIHFEVKAAMSSRPSSGSLAGESSRPGPRLAAKKVAARTIAAKKIAKKRV